MAKFVSSNFNSGSYGSAHPVYLIYIAGEEFSYQWATYPCNATDVPFWSGSAFMAPILGTTPIRDMTRKIDIGAGGNIAQVPTVKILLPNQGNIMNDLHPITLYGTTCEVRVIFIDIVNASWDNGLQMMWGYLEDMYWDFETVTIVLRDAGLVRHKTVPEKVISTIHHPDAPKDVIGKPYPIQYGKFGGNYLHRAAIAYENSLDLLKGHPQDFALAYVVKYTNIMIIPASGKTLLAGHTLRALTTFDGADMQAKNLVLWSDVQRAYCRTELGWGSSLIAGGAEYRQQQSSTQFGMLEFPNLIPAFISQVGTTTGANCVDEDPENELALINTQKAIYQIPRDQLKGFRAGLSYGLISVRASVRHVDIVNDKLYITFRKADETPSSVTVYIAGADMTSYTQMLAGFPGTAAWDFGKDDYQYLEIELGYLVDSGYDGATIYIKNLYLRSHDMDTAGNKNEVGFAGEMRKFGEWIDSLSHSNALNAGDLIENPAYVLESIFCDELGLSTLLTGSAIRLTDNNLNPPYFAVAHSASLAITGAITIELWLWPETFTLSPAGLEQSLIFKGEASSMYCAPYWVSLAHSTGRIRFHRGNGSAPDNYIEFAYSPTIGIWNHILISQEGGSGTKVSLYLNGEFKGMQALSAAIADHGNPLFIGCNAWWIYRSNVRFDGVRIWNTELSAADATALWNLGKGKNTFFKSANLKAMWSWNQLRLMPNGDTPSAPFLITDESGNWNTATSGNHGNMRYVTGWKAKIPYRFSQINEAAFDDVAAKREGWKFARSILDAEKSDHLISQLCFEAFLAQFTGADGRESVEAIEPLTTAPAIISSSDMLADDNGKPLGKVTRGQLTDVYTDFHVRYRKNYLSGDFESEIYCRNPDAAGFDATYCNFVTEASVYWQKCRDTYLAFRQMRFFTWELEWIRDAATAEMWLKLMIKHLTRRPHMLEMVCSLEHAKYEMCECRRHSNLLLPSDLSATTQWRMVGQQMNTTNDTVTSTWFDVGVP